MCDSESETSSNECTPPEVRELDQNAAGSRLLSESKEKYNKVYITFKSWCKTKNITELSENTLMAYLEELSEKYKAPSLWCIYSMLKSTLNTNDDHDISKYKKVLAFLKRKSDGYKAKKSKVLSSEEVEKFLNEAPDDIYLATKVALIFGIMGACRRQELVDIKVENITHHGEIILVKIPNNKNKIPRSFIIDGKFRALVLKYEALQPTQVPSNRFFVNFQKGKCTRQLIGKNKFGKMPSEIAKYLNLPDPHLYTGHSFRRTSAMLLADPGAIITTTPVTRRRGRWQSNAGTEDFIQDSTNIKREIENQITASINLDPSTSNYLDSEIPPIKIPKIEQQDEVQIEMSPNETEQQDEFQIKMSSNETTQIFHFHNCNFTIN